MTDITITLTPAQGFARRLQLWLAALCRRRAPAAHLANLSDHMLRDIGISRLQFDLMAVRTRRCTP